MVSTPAVSVVTSPGQSVIRFPPVVIRVWFFSSFSGLIVQKVKMCKLHFSTDLVLQIEMQQTTRKLTCSLKENPNLSIAHPLKQLLIARAIGTSQKLKRASSSD